MTDAQILDTLRRINREMVHTESPDELKQAVCDVIAESTPYLFAWIGVEEAPGGAVVPETSAGVDSGYLDAISVTADDSETGRGPTGRAVRTGETQVVRDVEEDPAYEPWREAARERGYRSSTAVPLVYEGHRYGVLNVYADRPDAFAGRERELLTGVGETIGYALHNFAVRTRERRQYRNLFEDAPIMYLLTRNEGGRAVVDDCNRRFLTKLGYDEEAVVGRDLAELYTAESARRLREYGYERALADEFATEERSFVTADGETLRTRMRAVPRIGRDGEVVGTITLYTDVSQQRQAESVLRHAKALDASMDGIAIFNADWECVHANDAFRSMFGNGAGRDVTGASYDVFLTDSEVGRFRTEVHSALEARGTWRGETEGVGADGEPVPLEVSVTAVEDVGVVAIVRDVSERKEHERRLRAERRRYRALNETAPDAILVANPETHELVEANSRAVELTGYSKAELVGMDQSALHPDEDRYRRFFEKHLAASEESGPTLLSEFEDGSDVLVERADGETRPVEINASVVDVGDERLFIGMFRDLTDRRERERELRQLRQQYETVFQNTQDALFLVDVEDEDTFRIARFNRREEDLPGLTSAATSGAALGDVLDEETASTVRARYRECLETRQPVTFEQELSLPDGDRIWQTKLTPVLVDGAVTQLVGAARDITALRSYERRLEAQRDQLELLNRIVRHDIRNDMSVVLGFGERLRDRVEGEALADVDRILGTSRHTVELTQTARDLAELIGRTSEPEVDPTDLGDALRDEFENVARSYPEATFHLGEMPDVTVPANDLLPAVFRNLLHNAVQHNAEGDSRVEVTVADRGDAVRVSVADDGPGVPEDQRESIFGRERKSLESPGTGMGLYVVDTLVDQYGGEVWVEDAELGGSVFHVELPTTDAD
jgi:PAS domain S-box-containing protein